MNFSQRLELDHRKLKDTFQIIYPIRKYLLLNQLNRRENSCLSYDLFASELTIKVIDFFGKIIINFSTTTFYLSVKKKFFSSFRVIN